MKLDPREVRIPMVLGNGTIVHGQRLCLLRAAKDPASADHAAKSAVKREYELQYLEAFSLTKPGRQALAAVRAYAGLPATWPWSVLSSREKQHSPYVFSVSNSKDIHGLGKDTGNSAELGIALAALAHLSQAKIGTVIATGALGDAGDDTTVQEVAHIAPKLAVLWQQFQTEDPGNPWPRPIRVILPRTEAGQPIPTGSAVPVPTEPLPDPALAASRDPVVWRDALIGHLQKAGIEVQTVATLGEAAKYLGIQRLAQTDLQRKVRLLSGITLPFLCLAAVAFWAVMRPLDLALASVPGVPAEMMPARGAFAGEGLPPELLKRCTDPQGNPLVRIDERLLINVAAAADLLPVRLALVSIGDKTGPSFDVKERVPGAAAASDGLMLQLRIEKSDKRPDDMEELRLAVVGVRWPFSIDEGELRQSILAAMEDQPADNRLNAGMERLHKEVTGFLPLTTHRVAPAYDPLCAGEVQ